MSSVIFNVCEFREVFAHFSDTEKMSDIALEMYFNLACERYHNDDTSAWPYDEEKGIKTRKHALYLYTCHIATLAMWGQSGQSGRVASASQGSVNTSFDLVKANKPTVDWFMQTPCGAQFYLQFLKPLIVGGKIYNFKKHHPWN